jgi:hypothetical protein
MMHYVTDQELAQIHWPFAQDPHQSVYVSRCVIEDQAPIVRVVHDPEGDWQFLGPVDDPDADGCKVSCFHCVIENDPSIRTLARLMRGWEASRSSPAGEWSLFKSDESRAE